ncbi:uncharacterized protein LOC129000130 [Macrosteles quadrilineatus]|uniref:uncharacterized protein LOC128985307 n=1 Tax=Macrosteles quadrilineatus TaxID=74068 RepID=UPI0023E286C7|nr:uncharacterized protein LOC128985307 [Macrosteles quadrilineatus]XP_054270812.1 uncharacterized protein LOC128991716 [Macrosteles quadrilineatus]XP_054272534.1 uncharacterized protein LOC128992817 [Macrosteles quadrilineatus]XP_054272660.1 uncharacterized protein LOC128992939 [Macrosteles quadrilineatus]XP_054272777.1 uncharacterized protein LOC128993048 [Macrosteles quadrilineatus]XP_054277911.1 uncharacterized protein LOC128996547 [Macrosteles quadrilineatus]XP_054279024.1 uncharacterize
MDVLDIFSSVPFDDTISHMEFHTHFPYSSTTLDNNDEIRIPIQQQDICIVPSMSYLYVEGKLLKSDNTATTKTKFTPNAFAFLFDEIRYEINGVEIDRIRNPGITSTMKGFASIGENSLRSLGNSGWPTEVNKLSSTLESHVTDTDGNFSFCIPLSRLLGFAEDYRKVIVNCRHELVLLRSAGDKNAVLWTSSGATDTTPEDIKVKLEKLCWRVPYVSLSDRQRIALLRHLERGTSVPVEYRSWELYEYPSLPQSNKQSWSVKTASQLEKPRYVIVAFQENRKNNMKKSAACFDHCKISNIKLHLNSINYPYDDLKLDIAKNHYAILYDMYTRFQESYYNVPSQPLLDVKNFISYAPLIVIDCSKQNESLRSAPVDIRLEFEASEAFPPGTAAYCLIIHDKSFSYEPATNLVHRIM